jgi:hypothetical protein
MGAIVLTCVISSSFAVFLSKRFHTYKDEQRGCFVAHQM